MSKFTISLAFVLVTQLQGAPIDAVVDLATLQAAALNAGSSWTSFELPKQKADVDRTVKLTVYNRAHEQIRLANCDESVEVPAGSQHVVTLKGRVGYWVVPKEVVAWDCKKGPFDFFGVGADLTGTELKMGVGANIVPDDMAGEGKWDEEKQETKPAKTPAEAETKEGAATTQTPKAAGEEVPKDEPSAVEAATEAPKVEEKPTQPVEEQEEGTAPGEKEGTAPGEKEGEEEADAPPSSTSVLGVVLATEGEGAPNVVACFHDSCTNALDLPAMPDSVALHIIGLKAPPVGNSKFLASQNHGWGGWGWGHHGHHHHHHGHGHGHWHGHHHGHGHGHGHWHGHHHHGHGHHHHSGGWR